MGTENLEIIVTPFAIEKLNGFRSEADAKKPLRVAVLGGGCSGFQYGFSFDDKREDDTEYKLDGVDVVVDKNSLEYLKGSTIDYIDKGISGQSGFAVKNPNSTGGCGCGKSFSA